MELASVLTCPSCGHAERLEMPVAACVFFHKCRSCRVLLKPKSGDCCVFCSYGSVPCPPKQSGNADCCASPEASAQWVSGAAVAGAQDVTTGESAMRFGALASDGAGVTGAIFAALCCAGTPLIVGALSALGLSALRKDAILWPAMLASLALALWGFWRGFRLHRNAGPMALGVAGSLALASGVIVVHGSPAMQMIYGGAAALLSATFWNIGARRA